MVIVMSVAVMAVTMAGISILMVEAVGVAQMVTMSMSRSRAMLRGDTNEADTKKGDDYHCTRIDTN